MNTNDTYVAYEYKNLAVKRESAALYADCLANFGWTLYEERDHSFRPIVVAGMNPANIHTGYVDVPKPIEMAEGFEMVTLKFKRDRNLDNKLEVNRLQRTCEEALSNIDSLEKKKSARTMGEALGGGIIGTVVLAFGINAFRVANPVLGVILVLVGVLGWGAGYLLNRKVGQSQNANGESKISEQLEMAYSACEQAHGLLAA